MGLIICDRIIMFFLGLMIFFLPISKAVIEVSATICIITWFIKKILRAKTKQSECCLVVNNIKSFFLQDLNLNYVLFLFVLANLLSVIFSSNFRLSMNTFLFKLVEYILIFVIVRDTVISRTRYRTIIWVILLSMFFIGTDGIFQIFTKYDLFRHRGLFKGRITASFINPNDLGSYLITVMPLVLALVLADIGKKIKSALIVVSLIAASVLMLTFSRGAIFAFVPGLIFLGIYTKKRLILFTFLSALLIALIVPIFLRSLPFHPLGRLLSFSLDGGAIDRKFLWKAAVRMFVARPLLGVGLGTFMENYPKFWLKPTTEISYAHNCYLQVLAETGIIGFGSFMLFLFIWFKNSVKKLSVFKPCVNIKDNFPYFSYLGLTAGIIAYLLNSFVDTNFYSLPIAVLFWFILGLQQAAEKMIKNDRAN